MRHVRMLGLLLAALFACSAVTAGSAFASKGVKVFKDCNVEATEAFEDPGNPVGERGQCDYAITEKGAEAGSFTVGNITVPFTKQVILQFRSVLNFEDGIEYYIPPSHGVPAIAPTPEPVPGEPIANISASEQEELGWPESLKYSYSQAQKHHEVRKVYETIELAGIPSIDRSKLVEGEGTAIEAPVMVKGENKWIAKLGDVCYIGSEESPIVQHLTTGASESPLTHEVLQGFPGEFEFQHEGNEVYIKRTDLVDNTYPVPGAVCTGPYSSYISAAIDKIFQLPEPAGASKTQLKGELYDGYSPWVKTLNLG